LTCKKSRSMRERERCGKKGRRRTRRHIFLTIRGQPGENLRAVKVDVCLGVSAVCGKGGLRRGDNVVSWMERKRQEEGEEKGATHVSLT
jgi:hypothetical protein